MINLTPHTITRKVHYNQIPQEITYLIGDDVAPRTAERIVKYCEDVAYKNFFIHLSAHNCEVTKSYPIVKSGRHGKLYTVIFNPAGAGHIVFCNVRTENGAAVGHASIEMVTA